MRNRRGRPVARTLAARAQAAALLLGIQIALAPAVDAADEQRGANQVQTAPVRTGKERLSSKAMDEQRVNNCKVPEALRGPKPRPDCDDAPAGPEAPSAVDVDG